VARSRPGVVYQNTFIDSNIWELPVPSSPNPPLSGDTAFRVIASTSGDADMRLSPDEKRIAFNSLRSGSSELWVSDRDGSQAKQLTRFEGGGRVGSPAWRPDGKLIAFDAIQTGTDNWSIRTVPADGGPVQSLTSDAFDSVRPSWSIDGQWIYFGSNRDGTWQIWKMSPSGGGLKQITHDGGMEPVVSLDGQHVYYAKFAVQGIWRVPIDGGPEIKVVEQGGGLSFDVAETGIFMIDTLAKPVPTIDMFSFASRTVVPIARLSATGNARFARAGYLNVSRDGHSILFMQFDQWLSDIEMLREFR
jgi:Tol biopolymer transport system component